MESLLQPRAQLGGSLTLSRTFPGIFLCILIPQASLRVAARFEADGEAPTAVQNVQRSCGTRFPSADEAILAEPGW